MWSKPSAGYTGRQGIRPEAKNRQLAEVYPANEIPPYVGSIQSVRVFSNYERIGYGHRPRRRQALLHHGQGQGVSRPLPMPAAGRATGAFVKVIGKRPPDPGVRQRSGRHLRRDRRPAGLSLGLHRPATTSDNLGYFDAIVIAWQTDDYAQIAEFLQKLHERYPDHPGITQAYMRADKVRDLAAARAQTAMEIDQTKERIQALQQAAPQKGGPTPAERQQQQRELEYQLAELTARQAQLDRLNQQLAGRKGPVRSSSARSSTRSAGKESA
ncbi:MAG: OmpH family outer membrane protein [Desulfomicrobium escambiense]|nr:OmpH family outer membrane protein [Desulfomicrobium escambiense]